MKLLKKEFGGERGVGNHAHPTHETTLSLRGACAFFAGELKQSPSSIEEIASQSTLAMT